ncbi:universal stress protein [Lacipirellula parvula]|uniref:UspA domain-containing protein n=1 Tax=Lacipirellula parvula TaxID=2650471 RepID=A0A5K7X8U6_9BACT|nr:universal stress protein [Lacipirellula parvula]BBO32287.1 hypothetical protein PLANPX_1899 [Lacipirellula parvula]
MRDFHDCQIIAPVDFSEESDRSLRTAIELSGDSTHVTVVHVMAPFVFAEPLIIGDAMSDEANRHELLTALKARYADSIYHGVNLRVITGNPGIEIVRIAADLKAGLIVMPSHGWTGLKHLLLGSVAERVVRTANCPVLILRK